MNYPSFSHSFRNIRRVGLMALAGLAFAPMLAGATDPIWTNYTIITTPPQIDARIVVNVGVISNIVSQKPVEMSNALIVTNRGMMSGTPGWYFNQSPVDKGFRAPVDIFSNRGVIESLDGLSTHAIHTINPSTLWIWATNIENRGVLRVGANGWLQLNGTNVNVNRGGLEVGTIVPIGTVNGPGLFLPEVGIYDNYWAQENADINYASIWDGIQASSPIHVVDTLAGPAITQVALLNPIAECISNSLGEITITATNEDASTREVTFSTNIIKQAIFLKLPNDPEVQAYLTWGPSTSLTNPMNTAAIILAYPMTNVAMGIMETNFLFFYDTLASETNRGVLQNYYEGTGRPANYLLSRVPDPTIQIGLPGIGYPLPNFFYDPRWVTNRPPVDQNTPTAAYSALVDNTVDTPPSIPAGTVTNVPGRVQIKAENLNLNAARIKGEGEIRIEARNLIGITNPAQIDCENLSFMLGASADNLDVSNLAKTEVKRLKGDLYAWSTMWANDLMYRTTNYIIGTNGPPTLSFLTNTARVRAHVLLLDCSVLLNKQPVYVHDFGTRTTNVVVNDSMVVVKSFYLDGTDATFNGDITLSNKITVNIIGAATIVEVPNFIATNAPNMLRLTNNGKFSCTNEMHFGDDRAVPYQALVNNGTLEAYAMSWNSDYFQNSGTIRAFGSLQMGGLNGQLDDGSSSSVGDTIVNCSTLKLNKYSLSARSITLGVSGALYDNGANSACSISASEGISLIQKPTQGDLLGTFLQLSTPDFFQIDNVWAADDRLATTNGYRDNVAVGKVKLGPAGTFSVFNFAPAGSANAIYIDLLDITDLGAAWEDYLMISPGMKVYFAAAKVGFQVPGSATPEEYLNGQLGGALVWVSSFAGPNSSVDVLLNGQTVKMNRALRDSKTIDSDNDGVPNFWDQFPLGGGSTTVGQGQPSVFPSLVSQGGANGNLSFAVTWSAAASSIYQIDYRTNLSAGTWQLLTRYTNNGSTSSTATVYDANAPALAPQRFYRVGRVQ